MILPVFHLSLIQYEFGWKFTYPLMTTAHTGKPAFGPNTGLEYSNFMDAYNAMKIIRDLTPYYHKLPIVIFSQSEEPHILANDDDHLVAILSYQ
jgi:hypothetical protein